MSFITPTPRKTLSTNDWLVAGLFVVFVIIGLALLVQQIITGADAPDFSRRSDEPLGAEGLARWLETLGYEVDTTRVGPFEIPPAADAVIMLEPESVSSGDYRAVNRWVREGGTLLLAGQGFGVSTIVTALQLGLTYDSLLPPLVWAENVLLASPPQDALAAARPQAYFAPTRHDYLTLYAAFNQPVVITLPLGQGRIIVSSTAYPFTNQGLTEQGNADLVLNLLRLIPSGATIWFDEYHHGDRVATGSANGNAARPDTTTDDRTGPFNWLRYNPTGQAFLYSGLVIFLALLLGGRALGRPLRPQTNHLRRPPLAYIQAIANLNRRAGHRVGILQGYHQRLKKELGQRYRLSPALSDDEFVAQLAKYNPGLDAAALLSLLQQLQNHQASEAELIHLASEVATWLKLG